MSLLNELNFFEDSKKLFIDRNLIKFYVASIVISIFILFICFNVKINNLRLELNELMQTRLEIINETSENTNNAKNDTSTIELETKRNSITSIESIEDYDNISSTLLEHIKKSIPDNLFLNDMIISNNKISITGYAKSLNIIATFQKNLSNDTLFTDVFVDNITNDLGNYTFTLTAKTES